MDGTAALKVNTSLGFRNDASPVDDNDGEDGDDDVMPWSVLLSDVKNGLEIVVKT